MFLRSKRRCKDGKEHRYWSVVENRRVRSGRVVLRQVLFLGDSSVRLKLEQIELLAEIQVFGFIGKVDRTL